MKLTYKTFLTHKEIEQYKNDIEIFETVRNSDFGALVRFYCDNEKVLDKIFGEDDDQLIYYNY